MKASTIVTLFGLLLGNFTPGASAAEPAHWLEAEPAAANQAEMHHVLQNKKIEMFMNWAIYLSRYEKPTMLPKVQFVPHEFLVESACYGVECKVLGWYNDTGVIYIDARFVDDDSLFSSSLIVHEMIHYLQHQSGEYTTSCLDVAARETEAYWIQQEYYVANGTFGQIRRHQYHCDVVSMTDSVSE